VSIIRVGLSETNKFAEGYDAIFGGKKKAPAKKPVAKAAAKKRTVAKPKKRK
jgi:hypothetical protein